jgi:hypothetical protein
MKNILLISTLLTVFTSISQVTILDVDFNNGIPSGWETIDNDNLVPYNNSNVSFMTEAWNLVEDYDSTSIGDSILVATSWFTDGGTADDYLISPAFTLGNYGNYISFDLRSIDASNPDGFQVLYSTGGTDISSFNNNPLVFDSIAISPYWTNYSVNLDDLGINNQAVYFAFRHYATDKYILGLDNISLRINDPVSIKENKKEQFSFYPNPAKNGINLVDVKENSLVTITDLNGKIVLNKIASNSILNFNLAKGLYLIQINNSIQKLIIE